MEREQLKQEILEQLRLEREIREQIKRESDEPTPKKRFAWLESKLGILLIGAIVSGIFIPGFQFTQETFKWMRQNRYNVLTRQIDDMRGSMKQLIETHAFLAETYNLGIAVPEELLQQSTTKAEQYRARVRELRMRRIQQNGAFASTIFFFPRTTQDDIRKAWNDYQQAVDRLQFVVDNSVRIGLQAARSAHNDALNNALQQLDRTVPECNEKYDYVLNLLRTQIAEVERESTRFQ